MKQTTKVVLLVCWVIITFPQAFFGYGTSLDSWLLAQNAENIWAAGAYSASRATGFPLHELIITPLIHFGGSLPANLFSLLGGFLLLLTLFALEKEGEYRHPVPAILCIGFLPIVTEQATVTLDFIFVPLFWALSYRELLRKRYLLFGLIIGISCGFRPSSGFMVLPGLVYILHQERDPRLALKVFLTALTTGTIAFSPSLIQYGYPHSVSTSVHDALSVTYRICIGGYRCLTVFGVVQSLVLAVVGVFALVRADKAYLRSGHFVFHAANIMIWGMLFTIFPLKSEYLLPAVPSVILLLDKIITKRTAMALAVLLLSYHVIQVDLLGGESGMRRVEVSLRPGYTVKHFMARRFMLSTREASTNHVAQEPTLLMFGDTWTTANNPEWVLDERRGLYRQREGRLYVSGRILDTERLRALHEAGIRMFVWRGQKMEYLQATDGAWRQYVTVVDELEDFYGHPVSGRPLQ